MEGKILKMAVAISDYKIDEIVEITGISKGQLYNLYKEESIKDEYKEKLNNLNLNIDWSQESTKSPIKKNYATPEAMEKIIEVMARALDLLQKDHEIYQNLVEQGVKDGTLKFIGKKISA